MTADSLDQGPAAQPAQVQPASQQPAGNPVPILLPPTTDSRRGHAKTIAATIVVLAVAIAVLAYALSVVPQQHTPPPTPANKTTTGVTAPPTTAAPANPVPVLGRSVVLSGVPDNSIYVKVVNNTGISRNSTSGLIVTSSNYALNFVLPLVAPPSVIPLNYTLAIPQGYANYSAPISSQITVYVFPNVSAASSYYLTNIIPTLKSYTALLGKYNVSTNYTAGYFDGMTSFTYTAQPLYRNTVLVTKAVLYRNYVIEGINLGVFHSYNVSYLNTITQSILNEVMNQT